MTVPLTLDRMRADVAALLHEDPSAIGDDDDLVALGLDSLLAMELVSRWGEATAHPLRFADLAAQPTLAGWWNVIRLLAARS